jgi:hypothetical protein
VKVRNLCELHARAGDDAMVARMRQINGELLHPLLMGCATRQTRIVQICLQSMQRLITYNALNLVSGGRVDILHSLNYSFTE